MNDPQQEGCQVDSRLPPLIAPKFSHHVFASRFGCKLFRF